MPIRLANDAHRPSKGVGLGRFIIFAIAVVFTGLCIGVVHSFLFYNHDFHGDASSNYVIATAIVDEFSFLPWDFYYSTQISVLKSQLFIAFFILLGYDGYTAFAFGTAVSLAFWLSLLYAILAAALRSPALGLLLTLVFAIPLNHLDSDFVLAQQSHLASIVLSIAAVFSSQRYTAGDGRGRAWLATLVVCLFAMAAESPARAALVAVPLAIAVWLAAQRQAFHPICAAIVGSLSAGYAANKLITSQRSVGADFLEIETLRDGDQILNGITTIGQKFWNEITNLNALAKAPHPDIITILLYAISLAFLAFVTAYYLGNLSELWARLSGVVLGARSSERGRADSIHEPLAVLKLTASTGLLVGVLAIASLNPNSIRHVLWAIAALKLCLFAEYFRALSKRFGGQLIPGILTLATCLLLSYWLANGAVSRVGFSDQNPLTVAVVNAAKERGIAHVYGTDFWTMMPLNTYIPDISAGVLVQVSGRIEPFQWLARRSWACVNEDVLYVIEADRWFDEAVLAAVREHPGAEKVSETGSTQIWLGRPVWTIPAGVDCALEHPRR